MNKYIFFFFEGGGVVKNTSAFGNTPCFGKRGPNPLLDDKILDLSKLKQTADNILKCC